MRCLVASLVAIALLAQPAFSDDANQLLESVHQSRSNWKGLPGFTARLKVFAEGKWQEGELTVAAPDQVEIDGIKLDNERLVHGAIGSLVRHRYSEGESDSVTGMRFADEVVDNPAGRLIESEDPAGGKFRIHDGVMREVLRETPRGKFTISVIDVYRGPDEKYLPQTYVVTFWDTKGQVTSSSTIKNEWTRIGKWDLPKVHTAFRASEGRRDVIRVEFHDHQISQ